MGSDIFVRNPDGNHTEHYHFSHSRAKALSTYGFWVGDFNARTVREVLVALNHVIMAMMEANIKPLVEFQDWVHNEGAPGAMGNAIYFRNGLEAHTNLDWILWIDS